MLTSLIFTGIIIYLVVQFRDLPRIYLLFIGPLFFIRTQFWLGLLMGCFLGALLLRVIFRKLQKWYRRYRKEYEKQFYYFAEFDKNSQVRFKRVTVKKFEKLMVLNKQKDRNLANTKSSL